MGEEWVGPGVAIGVGAGDGVLEIVKVNFLPLTEAVATGAPVSVAIQETRVPSIMAVI